MKLNKFFLLFIAVLLLQGDLALAQRKHKHKEDASGNILWSKIVWRSLDINDTNANASLLSLYDTAGNKTNISEVILAGLKSHMLYAHNVIADIKTIAFTPKDEWVYGDKNVADSNANEIDTAIAKENVWQIQHNVNGHNTQYFLIEYWEFHKDIGQMVVTLKWIGVCNNDASDKLKPLFAFKYTDLRPLLKQYIIKNAGIVNPVITCADFFESRRFSSKIIKLSGMD